MACSNRMSCLVGVLSTLALATHAQAATYYVATTGSDSNPGSANAPFRTIAYAVDKMVAGDTTYVKSGLYKETRAAMFKRSGTQSAPIRLLAAAGPSPVIDYSSATDYMRRVVLQAGKTTPIGWIVIEGFEIRNSPAPIMLFNAHDVIIRKNWVHHGVAQGILGIGKNLLIDRNVISQNGGVCMPNGKSANNPTRSCNQFHGVYLTGSDITIVNNLIYDNLSSGIHVAAYPWCDDGNCYGGGSKDKADPTYAGANNWLIANNTIAYNNHAAGIVVWMADATNSRIINNIFYENSQKSASTSDPQGINFWNAGKGHVIRNNIFYATAPGGRATYGGTPGWDTKYFEDDNIVNVSPPGFVSAPAAISGVPDFKLRSGAPAINKGMMLTEVSWDYLGGKRPFQSLQDIGAYEFGSAGEKPETIPDAPMSFNVQ